MITKLRNRISFFRYLVSFFFLILFLGFWSLQVLSGDKYLKMSESNQYMTKILDAPRGLMFDAKNTMLTANRIAYNFSLIREKITDREGSMARIRRLFGFSEGNLQERIDRYSSLPSFRPIIISEDIAFEHLAYVESHRLENPEFHISTQQKRIYLIPEKCSHVLGYVGEITASQKIRPEFGNFDTGDIIGQSGLERSFNPELTGKKGMSRVIVNNQGREIAVFENTPPVKGKDLRLSIIKSLHEVAADAFAGRSGAVIALNPQNGEIYLLASYPGYDPNMFTTRFSSKEWSDFTNNPKHPLQNRVISGLYSPGSVFKVVVSVAALEEGLITPDTRFFCGGSAPFYGKTFRCWKAGGHGSMNLQEALKHSCNIYFYNLGKILGIEKIHKYATMLGLGNMSGIDIPGEKPGLVPSPEWKKKTFGERWYPSEDISVVIGQGALQVSPLQLALMISAVSNGGRLVQPHIVTHIDGKEISRLNKPKAEYKFRRENLKVIKQALWEVVNSYGTGWRSAVQGRDVCGKTGTAQVISSKLKESFGSNVPEEYQEHAWFACFAPMENPEIAMVVLVENAGHGGEASAPIARAILEEFFRQKGGI